MGKRNELSFEEVAAKYPQLPRLNLLKTDLQRRGVFYTDETLKHTDEEKYQLAEANVYYPGLWKHKQKHVPEALVLRDGSIVLTSQNILSLEDDDPYIVDYRDGRFVVRDGETILDEVDFWEKPDFFGKYTSRGTLMESAVRARPQRINIVPVSNCCFWKNGHGCRFCDLTPRSEEEVRKNKLHPEDAYEIVREALKQKGRFATFCITMGSDIGGKVPFDDELDYYIEILQAIGRNFEGKFPCQVITTALNYDQLSRLYNETGLTGYTADIEVLNEEKFNWICPGKAEHIGYKEWKKRLVDAVGIFGRGNVNTGTVGGVELAKPTGFKSESEALKNILEEAETLISNGVGVVYIVWVPRQQSVFKDQQNASLDYYAQLTLGLDSLTRKYGLSMDFDDYRRCGNHPNTDLLRVA